MSEHAYIAKKECGCIVMVVVDEPSHRRETAKEVGKAIRQGYIVERAPIEYVRKHWLCEIHEAKETTERIIGRLKGGENV